MDEFAGRTDENLREVSTEIRELRDGIRGAETRLRSETDQRLTHMERRFDVMFGAMITGFVGLIITHFLG